MAEESNNLSDKILCACGRCNEWIPSINKLGRHAKFKHGHNLRLPEVIEKSNENRPKQPRGKDSPYWKGGRRINKQGYVLIYMPDHPDALKGCVLEHRWIMEQIIGRRLQSSEIVHHKNGNRADNRQSNLVMMSQSKHARDHETIDMSKRKCCDCGGKETYRRNWHVAGVDKFRCSYCYHRLYHILYKKKKSQ